jgi:hypothetical protein
LIAEIQNLTDGDELALWAHRRLPAKNTLTGDDAHAIEIACQAVLDRLKPHAPDDLEQIPNSESISGNPNQGSENVVAAITDSASRAGRKDMVTPIRKSVRRRSKMHLAFVAAQPCLICQRTPCDAHHLKFAQARSLGRKVSDEFTVPLCRDHHHALHRHGNEMAWWANLQMAPMETARELWAATLLQMDPPSDRNTAAMRQFRQASNLDPGIDAESVASRNAGRTGP